MDYDTGPGENIDLADQLLRGAADLSEGTTDTEQKVDRMVAIAHARAVTALAQNVYVLADAMYRRNDDD